MSTIKLVLILMLSVISISAFSQQADNSTDALSGYVDIQVDISGLKDTSGVFSIRIGGKTLEYNKQDNILSAKCYIDEPKRSYFTFHSHQAIANNPNKPLNEISAEYQNYYEFFAVPGQLHIVAKSSVHDSQIVNASKPQLDYASLLKQEEISNLNFMKANRDLIDQFKPFVFKKHNDAVQEAFQQRAKLAHEKFKNDVILKYIKANRDSPTAIWLLDQFYNSGTENNKLLASLHQNFTNRIKALPTAKYIYQKVNNL